MINQVLMKLNPLFSIQCPAFGDVSLLAVENESEYLTW